MRRLAFSQRGGVTRANVLKTMEELEANASLPEDLIEWCENDVAHPPVHAPEEGPAIREECPDGRAQGLAGGDSRVELLGVGPTFPPDEYRYVFDGMKDDVAAGFRETVRILFGLRSAGSYPFRSGKHCQWCSYETACRRNHPPTVDREQNSTDSEPFHKMHEKNTRKPMIADVAGRTR